MSSTNPENTAQNPKIDVDHKGILPLSQFTDDFDKSLSLVPEYDIYTFYHLSDENKKIAVEMLVDRCFHEVDIRAPQALLELHLRERLPDLKKAMEKRDGIMQLHLCWAVFRFTQDEELVKYVRKNLDHENSEVRDTAVDFLVRFKAEKDAGLMKLRLFDDDGQVRYRSAEALAFRRGVYSLFAYPKGSHYLLPMKIRSRFEYIWRPAAEEFLELLEKIELGISPLDLGMMPLQGQISPAKGHFVSSYATPERKPPGKRLYPIAALNQMQGGEREWAFIVLMLKLEDWDEKAVRALADWSQKEALSAFREFLGMPVPPHFALELARALWILDEDPKGIKTLRSLENSQDEVLLDRLEEVIDELEDLGAPV